MAMLIVHGKNDLYLWLVKILTIHIPDSVDFDDQEALLAIATGMYGKGKLTLGQAADLAGMSKQAFMEILGDYGVSVFNFPSSDLDRDIANAKSYHL
jgi:predicted HTH domain antitoxin